MLQHRGRRLIKGQTLLALMLSLALSSLLIFGIIQFYSYSQQQNRQILLKLQLQMELQRAIQTIGKDLRRAGFRALSSNVEKSNFHLFELPQIPTDIALYSANNLAESAVQNDCVLFFYDLDANGCLGSTSRQCIKNEQNMTSEVGRELFGYRQNGMSLESRTYGNKANNRCQKMQCQSYLQAKACNDTGWSKMLDEEQYEITKLDFHWLDEAQDFYAIEVALACRLKVHPQIHYETSLVIPLLNQRKIIE